MLITLRKRWPGETDVQIQRAVEIIMSGGTAIVGTETFYAIAANPFLDQAVHRIFSIKKRSFGSPLPLIATSQETIISKIDHMPKLAGTLMKAFWPGSLTIILEAKGNFSKYVRNDFGQIGVRVPPECPARYLSAKAGGWITATSANLSGDPPPKTVTEIPSEIMELVDVVIDSGPCPVGLPSTVIEVKGSSWNILRLGAICEEAIFNALEQTANLNNLDRNDQSSIK